MSLTFLFALTVTLAYSASAQTPPELHIVLDEALCKEVEQVSASVSVVINGGVTRAATKVSPCNWRLGEIGKHNPDISYFSLRLHGHGRTPCEHATAIGKSDDLQLVFRTRGRKVVHEIETGFPLDYVRVSITGYGGAPCLEAGSVPPGTVTDIQFDIEDLRLGLFKKKPVACGVSLYDITDKATKRGSLDITFEQIVPAVLKEGLEGKNCYAPTFIPPEAIEQNHRRKTALKITVK